MKKTKLEQYNDKSKDLLHWIKNHLSKKIYKLKVKKGFVTDEKKVDEDTKYFNRDTNFNLILLSNTIEELKENANQIALAMDGLRNYSSPLIAFYQNVIKDKKILSLKDIDTNYIHSYTRKNKLSSNYYVQIKSLFIFIDKNMTDDYRFDIGEKKDGSKFKRPVKATKEKTFNYLEPDEFAKFVASIKNYKSNHPNPHLLKLMVKIFCFGGLRADEAQHLKEEDITFKTLDGDKYMQLYIVGKGGKERHGYILYELVKDDYEKYQEVKKANNHNTEYLFYTREFKMFSDKRIYDIIKDFQVKSKVEAKKLNTHLLRRTMATYLHFRGVKLETISKILGHSDEESIEFYVFATKSKKRKVSDLFKFI